MKWDDASRDVKLGERVEIYCTNLDMSTNCYDRYYIARGEQIVDVWPIMGRKRRRPSVNYASSGLITRPLTSVSRKSRPCERNVSFV